MITITKKDNYIKIQGHTDVDMCNIITGMVYYIANFLQNYEENIIEFEDNEIEDYIMISANKHNKILDLSFDTFIRLCESLIESGKQNQIKIIK